MVVRKTSRIAGDGRSVTFSGKASSNILAIRDIAVIALWLGHESIETTHVYLEADLATKERALQKLAPCEAPLSRFTADDPLLTFLTSL